MKDFLAMTAVFALWALLGAGLMSESGSHENARPGATLEASGLPYGYRDTCFTDWNAYAEPWVCFDHDGKLVSIDD